MKQSPYAKRYQLSKKYHIYFRGPVQAEEWPSTHKDLFSHIKLLGRKTWEEHDEAIDFDSLNKKPWRSFTRKRASKLSLYAARCVDESLNEEGWRLKLEGEVLSRFTTEVAWYDKRCRGRLWRSEVEVTLNEQDQTLKSLEERRLSRQPCVCDHINGIEERPEDGLNALFTDRACEAIEYPEDDLKVELQKSQRPDRIYGLRTTKRFNKVLDSPNYSIANPGSIRLSPLREEGDALIFPFLVIEAKSEKGQEGFSRIRSQTAFPIREILKIQDGLYQANGISTAWHEGPLCWFLSYRGEAWRVSAAFVDRSSGEPHFHVVDLWNGEIQSKDGALQLLLIVDYIFDWARDSYRENILRELKIFAGLGNAGSSSSDTDVFSLQIPPIHISLWMENVQETLSAKDSVEPESSLPQQQTQYDLPLRAIRKAAFIQSRLVALYITKQNLDDLLLSMSNTRALTFLRLVRKALKESSCRVTASTLHVLELEWTGNSNVPTGDYNPNEEFLVCFTLSAYFSPLWEQTREFCYLAVSLAALKKLMSRDWRLKRKLSFFTHVHPLISVVSLKIVLNNFLSISLKENLRAAVSRICLALREIKVPTSTPSGLIVRVKPSRGSVISFTGSFGFVKEQNGFARQAVCSVYSLLKTGRRLPKETFLKLSSRLDVQNQGGASFDLSSIFDPNLSEHLFDLPAVFIRDESNLSIWLMDHEFDLLNLEKLVATIRGVNQIKIWMRTQFQRVAPTFRGKWNMSLPVIGDIALYGNVESWMNQLEKEASKRSKDCAKQPHGQKKLSSGRSTQVEIAESSVTQPKQDPRISGYSWPDAMRIRDITADVSSSDESENTSQETVSENRKRKLSDTGWDMVEPREGHRHGSI